MTTAGSDGFTGSVLGLAGSVPGPTNLVRGLTGSALWVTTGRQRYRAARSEESAAATVGTMRIVSFLPSATDIIAELGLLDSLVGVSEDCNWPPEVASKPLVARTRIDVSELSAAEIDRLVNASTAEAHSLYAVDARLMEELGPDLVITQDLCEVCAVSSGDLATACPIRTEVFSMNPHSLEDVIASVSDLAERLGVQERGRAVAGAMRTKIEAVRAAVKGLHRPRVFVAEWMDPPYGSGHWLPEMVQAAGGTNLLSGPGEYSFATSWEAVLAEEPELVVLAACGFDLEQALERTGELCLPVRTVVVDGDAYYSRPAPRVADGVRQLAHLLHPDAVEDPGLPAVELPLGAVHAQ
jgi:iron complex transport system substrate-binding protein